MAASPRLRHCLGLNSFYSVEAHTNVTGPLTFPGPSSSASVIYDADLTYTIVGYTGTGFIEPTFFGNAIADPEASSDAFAQLTFGSINDSANINGEFSSGERIPFVFGVPFTTHLHMEVTAAGEQLFAGCFCGGGNATIQFYPLDFNPIVFLADGQPAPGAFVFSTPEPSTLWMTAAGVGLFLLAKRVFSFRTADRAARVGSPMR